MKVYCNNCKKEVSVKNNKCPNCGLLFDESVVEDANDIIQERKDPTYRRYSNVATILEIIGAFVMIGGLLVGLFFGKTIHGTEGFTTFLIYLGCSLVSGMVFIGFGTIIQLLFDIRKKLYEKK